MPYGILRFEKRRGGPASALEKHHERKKQQYASNPDIDTEHSEMNFHLVQPRAKYYSEIQRRIEKVQKENPKCKVRKDSVKFIDTIVTASPEFFDRRSAEETEKYFKHALEFLQEEVGADNIFSAVVHMDERNHSRRRSIETSCTDNTARCFFWTFFMGILITLLRNTDAASKSRF